MLGLDEIDRSQLALAGSDPVGATEAVMLALAGSGRELIVVRGPGFRNHAATELAATFVRSRGGAVTFVDDPPSLAPVLADCDAAISAAGGTPTELAYLGRPTYAIAIVDDQLDVAARLARADLVAGGNPLSAMSPVGLGVQIAMFLDDPGRRRALAAAAAASVDGRGHVCILAALAALPTPL